jgi:hypothetical protein
MRCWEWRAFLADDKLHEDAFKVVSFETSGARPLERSKL